MQLRKELELLAPARNMDIGIAAIDCGADAVYIAGPAFGARQAAGNKMEDIAALCKYAHKFGARIFVTLNTIIYDGELARAYDLLDAVADAGADAVIIQDLALTDVGRQFAAKSVLGTFPNLKTSSGLPLHASTQCAIRTPERAKFLEDLGFSRLVLERELSLEQIRKIREAVDCELEFFVHGALCVCYSGQCYLSEMISGRSANRGACLQACRSRYDLIDENGKKLVTDKALLSLKDLNLKDRLEDLADAGITSFKIEGRLKNLSYVKNIVRDYSVALDDIVSRRRDFRRASFGKVYGGFEPQADRTFNRGYTSLFIDGNRGKWACPDAAKSMGEKIGTVSGLNARKDRIYVTPAKNGLVLNNGDGFSFTARNGEVCGFRADVCKGMSIECKPVKELYEGATLFRNINVAFEKQIAGARMQRLIPVSVFVRSEEKDEGILLSVSATSEDGRSAEYSAVHGEGKAENVGRMKEIISAQMSKTTDIFRFETERIEGDVMPFLSSAAVNSVRRALAEKLASEECRKVPLFLAHLPERLPAAGEVSYKENVSNKVSAAMFRQMGADGIEQAYELNHRKGTELMRTKHCIRHELGLCPFSFRKAKSGSAAPGKLYLENNGRLLALEFDCQSCEMVVKQA